MPQLRSVSAAEAQELRARKLLAQYEPVLLDAIERKRQYAAYSLCIEDTKTPGYHAEEHVRYS